MQPPPPPPEHGWPSSPGGNDATPPGRPGPLPVPPAPPAAAPWPPASPPGAPAPYPASPPGTPAAAPWPSAPPPGAYPSGTPIPALGPAVPPPGAAMPPGQPPQGGWPPPGGPPYGPYPPPGPAGAGGRGGNGKVIGIVAGVLVGVLLLCGGAVTAGIILVQRDVSTEPDSGPGDDPGGDPPVAGPIDWMPWTQNASELDSLWSTLGDEFSAAGAGTVEVTPVPRESYAVQLAVRMGAGDPPDMFVTGGGDQLRDYVEQGLVRDLTEDLADVIAALPEAVVDPYTIDGRIYGLPYLATVVGLWYNRALFADAGLDPDRPPETWSELLAAVDTLRAAGTVPIAIGGLDPWTALLWYGCLATSVAGAGAFDAAAQDRSLSENPGFLRAAELLADLVQTGPFQEGHEVASYIGPNGSVELMGGGLAAMELMGSWAPALYGTAGGDGLGDDLGWFPFPAVEGGSGDRGDVYGGGDGFAIGADAPATTVDLLRFLLSADTYPRILAAEPGQLSVRADTAPPADANQARQQEILRGAAGMQLYLDTQLPQPVSQSLLENLQLLMVGEQSPDEAIDRVTGRWQEEEG